MPPPWIHLWNDTTLLLHHPYIVCTSFCQLCLVFVTCALGGLWKVVGWHVVHVDVDGEVMLWVAANHY